jgi:hypothetical protein
MTRALIRERLLAQARRRASGASSSLPGLTGPALKGKSGRTEDTEREPPVATTSVVRCAEQPRRAILDADLQTRLRTEPDTGR